MTNQFFGQRWYAAAYADAVEVPVPLGAPCLYCEELIDEDDSGVFIGYVGGTTEQVRRWAQAPNESDPPRLLQVPVHIECQLRSILGSVEHLTKRCSCYGGTEPDGTTREQAKATLAWLREHPGTL